MTDLDIAHAAMDADPENDAKRLQFYERLADTELFMLLGAEAEGDKVEPELFEIEDQNFVLIFDREAEVTFKGHIITQAEDGVSVKPPY